MGTRAHRADKASTLAAALWGAPYPPTGLLYAVLDPRNWLTGAAGLGRWR